ncbi:Rv1355c family protein [Actinomycetospora soli]|uniref:Rv1355c family protein n=1 Tax=Actinomycetospora soli TaxID=2893887 RepID=UPI001E3BF108|nr:Rv1355c family protein [Actinomycetospora soli]MCD2188292.1 Rv1355c family protein [Actinomycetospora soli]
MSEEAIRAEPVDGPALEALRADPSVSVVDLRATQTAELAALRGPAVTPGTRWVHYPWRRAVVGLLDPAGLRRLRLDRNRNKITDAEQARLGRLRIGVAGLSVGHSIAHTLALEGLCGQLRLADFDTVETSNLNRIPVGLFEVGENKAVVAARRIAELDPDLDLEVWTDGVTPDDVDAFLDGLDVLVEEADSLDVKILLRERARDLGLPVLMATSDRGLVDAERFDLEPDRPLVHGLAGDLSVELLAGLEPRDKAPYVLRIVGAEHVSARAAASMVEVGTTLSTWPQLGGDVVLGAATVAAAVRRIGLGLDLPSGRSRVDLDEVLTHPEATDGTDPASWGTDEQPDPDPVLEAVRRAPSGGNVQPWHVERTPDELRLYLDRTRTTTMDVAFRGSHVALGAALFNARAAAARAGCLGPVALFPDGASPDLVATRRFAPGTDPRLAAADVLGRGTDRGTGRPRPLGVATRLALDEAAHAEGGRLHLLEPGEPMRAVGEAVAAADRVRYLTERLHREMVGELVERGEPTGIDVASLGLSAADVATLAIVRRPEVMRTLADWDAGEALTEDTRRRVASSSALAVVTVDGVRPADFVRGGQAVEAVWVAAQEHGLAVHPTSPVFLYAVDPDDLRELSEPYADDLARLRRTFRAAVGLDDGESVALVLRLAHTDAPPVRSRRRPIGHVTLPR